VKKSATSFQCATYTPWMQQLFAARSLALTDLLLAPALGALVLFILEAEKTLLRRAGWG